MGVRLVKAMSSLVSNSAMTTARRTLKWLWVGALRSTGVFYFIKRKIAAEGGVIVLTFHRVLPEREYSQTHSQHGLLVRDKTFEALANYIEKSFQAVSLDNVGSFGNSDKRKPRIAFTFDDGWKDNVQYAVPIARKHQIPITLFVCTAKVNLETPFWPERVSVFLKILKAQRNGIQALETFLVQEFKDAALAVLPLEDVESRDRLIELLKSVRSHDREEIVHKMFNLIGESMRIESDCELDATLNWSDIEMLRESGVTIGSHTKSHIVLTSVKQSEAMQEVVQSKSEIERRLKTDCKYFAYPNGDWSPETAEVVRMAGYKFAFINEEGIWTNSTDLAVIPRVNIWEGNLTNSSGNFSSAMFEYEPCGRHTFGIGIRRLDKGNRKKRRLLEYWPLHRIWAFNNKNAAEVRVVTE